MHTPGPWERDGTTIYALHHHGDFKNGKPLLVNRFCAHVEACLSQGGSKEEAEANARLIAAAPDLLSALENRPLFEGDPTTAQGREIVRWETQCCAAIAKAQPKTTG